ncbi:hypothetical protein BIW11_14252, partial [Tropilaelaps mercedesae]
MGGNVRSRTEYRNHSNIMQNVCITSNQRYEIIVFATVVAAASAGHLGLGLGHQAIAATPLAVAAPIAVSAPVISKVAYAAPALAINHAVPAKIAV